MRDVELTHTNCPRGLTIQPQAFLTKMFEKRNEQKLKTQSSLFRIKEQNKRQIKKPINRQKQDFPEGHSAVVPPESIPNSEVKGSDADGSVVIRHVRVGRLQGFIKLAHYFSELT